MRVFANIQNLYITAIATANRRTTIRQAYVSRHYSWSIKSPHEIPLILLLNITEGFKGCPQPSPHSAVRRKPLGQKFNWETYGIFPHKESLILATAGQVT